MHRPRSLRSRLFFWFAGAILLASLTTLLVYHSTRPDAVTGADIMARNVSTHLTDTWDDPEATRAYVEEVRDVTGFDVKLVRDPRKLPPRVHAAARRGMLFAPDNPAHIYIPVTRGQELLGALEMEKFGPKPMTWPWWRFALAIGLAAAILSMTAGRVAQRLARPLERLAGAADRFGGGDLAFRADVAGTHRWVAREVRDVGVAFNRMADRVEAMVRGQRELLGAISHELRSPLGRARVALEIARERLPPGDPAQPSAGALDELERNLGSVDGILGDLLDVTRAGLADLRTERRAFTPWLRAKLGEEPSPPEIRVVLDPDVESLELAFDGPLLARAVHNLVLNARAHGHPEDRPLEVHVTRTPSAMLRLAVRDRGPGFPEGLAARAFDPFVRGDAARSRPTAGAGSGLGLTIVRRVVEAHGGRAFAGNAAPSEGGEGAVGAEVGFELPVAPPAR